MVSLLPRKTLRDLLIMKLQSLYDAEYELVKALTKMAKKATDAELKSGFEKHRLITRGHMAMVEKSIEELTGKKARKSRDNAVRGIIANMERLMSTVRGKESVDAALVASARTMKQYEIAEYAAASGWASLLGLEAVKRALWETYKEEKNTDEFLESLSSGIYDKAHAAKGEKNSM